MAPQAQLEESANDLGSAGSGRSQKTVPLGVSDGAGPRFLSDFSENRAVRPPTCSKKGLTKKRTHRQTKSGRSRARPGPCFGQLNVSYQSQNLPKVVPKTSRGSLLRTRLKGTSGFSSVVGTLLKLRLRRKNALLKRILGAERATGAQAIVNHHSYRF